MNTKQGHPVSKLTGNFHTYNEYIYSRGKLRYQQNEKEERKKNITNLFKQTQIHT